MVLMQNQVDIGRLTIDGRLVHSSHKGRFFTAGRGVASDALFQVG